MVTSLPSLVVPMTLVSGAPIMTSSWMAESFRPLASSSPVAADDFCYLTNDTLASCRVYDYEAEAWKTLYDLDAAAGDDPYAFFLSGSRALLTVENPNASTDKEIILFRDSYGSAIASLLAEGYAKITLIDIRYLAPELLPRFVDFTGKDVLFLYSTTVLNSSNTLR